MSTEKSIERQQAEAFVRHQYGLDEFAERFESLVKGVMERAALRKGIVSQYTPTLTADVLQKARPVDVDVDLDKAHGDGKVKKVMHEFKHKKLRSGSKKGPKVTKRKQAVAIALDEARRAGEDVPAKKSLTAYGTLKKGNYSTMGPHPTKQKIKQAQTFHAQHLAGKKLPTEHHQYISLYHPKESIREGHGLGGAFRKSLAPVSAYGALEKAMIHGKLMGHSPIHAKGRTKTSATHVSWHHTADGGHVVRLHNLVGGESRSSTFKTKAGAHNEFNTWAKRKIGGAKKSLVAYGR